MITLLVILMAMNESFNIARKTFYFEYIKIINFLEMISKY